MPAPERACSSTGCLTARGPLGTATSRGRTTLLPPQWRNAARTGASPSSRLPVFMASASCPSRPRITTFCWSKAAASALRWRPFSPRCAPQPSMVLAGHTAPVVALSVSPDGTTLASASWDHTARLWPLGGGAPRLIEGHAQNVNGVAFAPDGRALVTAGYDATLRISPLLGGGAPVITTLPTPLNAVAVAPDGEIVTAGAAGKVYVLSAAGEVTGEIEAAQAPIIAVALSRDGSLIAAARVRGSVALIDPRARKLERTLVGPGLPVWSAAFFPDGRTLLTGGSDRMIRRWDAVTGEPIGNVVMGGPEDPLAPFAGDPGAEVFRACVACHTLNPNDGVRAGPTLAGVFGRRIATLPGYNFSDALKKLDIVWTPETVSKLFEVGPLAYTPGTKMPEQRIGSAEDRAALVKFLEKTTKTP